jgi:hypothetical protein
MAWMEMVGGFPLLAGGFCFATQQRSGGVGAAPFLFDDPMFMIFLR